MKELKTSLFRCTCVLGLSLVSLLSASCNKFPVISAGDTKTGKDFFVDRGNVYIRKVDVWSSSHRVFLWSWTMGDANAFDYGIVPEGGKQLFPPNNDHPREIAEGEEIVINILYYYDSAWPPAASAGNEIKAFQRAGNRFISIPLTRASARIPIWESDEIRQAFEKQIAAEIDISNPPLFMQMAMNPNATASQQLLIDAMMKQVGSENPREAYIELRAEDIFAFYGLKISDITILADFPNITKLVIYDGEVSDVRPLAKLNGLTFLRLEHNGIRDLSPLLELQHLKRLDITGNPIQDSSIVNMLRQRGVKVVE